MRAPFYLNIYQGLSLCRELLTQMTSWLVYLMVIVNCLCKDYSAGVTCLDPILVPATQTCFFAWVSVIA